MDASPAELYLGVLLIRLILPCSILGGVIWAHFRISRALRDRLELPADMKASTAGLKHEVAELKESIERHIGKDAARWKEIAKNAAPGVALVPSVLETPKAKASVVPPQVWEDSSKAQRDVFISKGMLPPAR